MASHVVLYKSVQGLPATNYDRQFSLLQQLFSHCTSYHCTTLRLPFVCESLNILYDKNSPPMICIHNQEEHRPY